MKPQWFHGYYWLILLALLLYVPLVLFGGFGTSDDLSLVAHIGSDYWQDLKYSLSRSGHVSRPLYGFIQTTALHLFGSSYLLYNIFRLLLWTALIYIAHLVFKKSLGRNNALLFLFFLSFPIFASSQLFNSMQMGYILSIIFFLLALRGIQNDKSKDTFRFYFIYFSWSLLALLSCEIVFPLFLFPLLQLWSNSNRIIKFRNVFFTTGLVFITVLILKFVIGPYYQIGDEVYGFSLSHHSILQGLYYFFAMFVEIPLLLLEVIPFYLSEPLLWISLLVIPLVYCSNLESNKKWHKRTLLHAFITIFACCFIFILSNYPAVTYGLYNKMLLPSHLFVSLVLALVCIWLLNSRLYLLSYVISVLWFASMEMQVINTIRSWDKRTEVYGDLIPLLEKANTLDHVFVEVPYFLNSNYNNEPVFSLTKDFQGGLTLNGYGGPSDHLFTYTPRMIDSPQYWYRHNIHTIIQELNIDSFTFFSVNGEKRNFTNIDQFKVSQYPNLRHECIRAELRSLISKSFKK